MDVTTHCFKDNLNFFDAIICDPPYGYRAGARETGLGRRQKARKADREKYQEEHPEEKEEPKKDDGLYLVKEFKRTLKVIDFGEKEKLDSLFRLEWSVLCLFDPYLLY